jgi:large subunit ribosomal protein L4
VLGDLTRAERIFTVPSFAIADGKTKSFVAAVNEITQADRKVLLVGNFDDNTTLAARNAAWTQLVTATDVNVEQLLLAKVIILVGDAVSTLAQRTV